MPMDTSGKDGTIRAVFHEVDPLGLRIVPFKAPTPVELAHDFLWRVHSQAPAAGELTIFNRSHYEDLLVPTVLGALDAAAFQQRCRHIRQFEEMLADSGATILKCMPGFFAGKLSSINAIARACSTPLFS